MKMKRFKPICILLAAILIGSFSFLGCIEEGDKKEEVKTYTVKFSANGGEGTMSDVIRSVNDNKALPANTFTKDDYIFTGWNTLPSGSGTSFPDEVKANISAKNSGTVILFAQWMSEEAASAEPVEVSSMSGFTKTSNTTLFLHPSYENKFNVVRVISPPAINPPSDPNQSDYAYITQSLSAYANKTVTISISMNVWLVEKSAAIAWQASLGSTYPFITNKSLANLEADKWTKVEGSEKVTVPSGGGTLYISTGHSSWNATGGDKPSPNPNAVWPVKEMYIADLFVKIDDGSPVSTADVILTVGSTMDLNEMAAAYGIPETNRTWEKDPSWAPQIDVSSVGLVTAKSVSVNGGGQYRNGAATGTATVKVSSGGKSKSFVVQTTTAGQEGILSLPPMKDRVTQKFPLFGNIATRSDASVSGTGITNTALTRHFNALTSENDMKPDAITSARNTTSGEITYTYTNADRFVNSAFASGMNVIGHTLLWHSQNPAWITEQITSTTGAPAATTIMKKYITDVVTHFKGKIHTWDVLNEVFTDAGGYRTTENPWYIAIGKDFIYEGYLAARLADPDAILYYNDYNTDSAVKADAIIAMVKEVNEKYLSRSGKDSGDDRLLIEGIGMQEHHNQGIAAASIRATLNKLRALSFEGSARKIKVSVSELDVIAQPWNGYSSNTGTGVAGSTVTNDGLITQADNYESYMKVYLDFTDIIERISIWGVRDDLSWRAKGLPLLFDQYSRAKPAYYKFIGTLPALP